MSVDLFGIGTSALLSFQRGLATTGHNIANVNTPGYSRQAVLFNNRNPFFAGDGYIGQGVEVTTVRRIFNQFVNDQVLVNNSVFNQHDTFRSLASVLDGLSAQDGTSLAPGMQGFFDAVQEVATSPADVATRQVMLSDSQTLVDRFHLLNGEYEHLANQVDNQLDAIVTDINSLSGAIADVNQQIREAGGAAHTPNDLLDHRDQLISQLSELVSVSTVEQDDGSLNVFIGSGQGLVVGVTANQLSVEALGSDPEQLDIALVTPSSTLRITDNIRGGSLGANLEFRDTTLTEARNELGRIAIGLAISFNQQHAQGIDLDGNVGGDYFVVAQPSVLDDPGNSTFGVSSIDVQFEDVSGLTAHDYQLDFDGATWTLTDLYTGATVPMTADGGDYLADGLRITPDPGAIAGDRYTIRPTRYGAADLELAITDPLQIAAALTHATDVGLDNTGGATISPVEVTDSSDAGFFTDLNIVFDNPPTTFSINGAPSQPYTDGADIDINGIRFQINGTPAAGDTFAITDNRGAVGDGSNALSLAQLQQSMMIGGGTQSLFGAYDQYVAAIGARTRQAEITADSQSIVLEQSIAQQQAVSGVNLDEEAANLQMFQQAYQAAAQIIAAADTVFNTLLSVTRR